MFSLFILATKISVVLNKCRCLICTQKSGKKVSFKCRGRILAVTASVTFTEVTLVLIAMITSVTMSVAPAG